MYVVYPFFKRILDFFLSVVGLFILSPLLLVVSILLFITGHGNPLFFQKRSGLNGKTFKVVKFKTMVDKKDNDGNLLEDEYRLTKLGKFLRSTSIDEIPQLINVIINDMSLIGPRPLLVEYISLYNDVQRKRLNVKPGITGWAQINGRNTISWKQKFELDIWYVDNISFFIDFKIFILTIIKVLKSEGINFNSKFTSERFNGNN
ncbi:MAG: lipid carrier--UDP-N-acetylgalactosaminyltransferase [Candidatus Marinimicrobia bacterium]|nr:lipid carrier--UDP-N-acetylgalactosaminyltransferase [Candidatus Neomarinimicrobiota bacterium]|tara:strand:+ start:7757 stop:8368 length:612 start_codon:yes stop_codon:yes gene_type:complete